MARWSATWSPEGMQHIRDDNAMMRNAIHRFCVLTGCPPDRDINGQIQWLDEVCQRLRDGAYSSAESEYSPYEDEGVNP